VAVDALPPAAGGGGPAPAGAGPAPAGSPTPGKPSNEFKLLKRQVDQQAGTATLVVKLPGAGKLILAGDGVRRVTERTSAAAKLTLSVKPSPKTAKLLRATGAAQVKVKLTYTPTGGDPRTRNVSLTLKLPSSAD
jgi:hypothetical protein